MKTLKEVEELTGIKATTLRQRLNRGTLQGIKKGRDWFIDDKVVKSLIPPAEKEIKKDKIKM